MAVYVAWKDVGLVSNTNGWSQVPEYLSVQFGGVWLGAVPAHSWVGPDPWCLQYREGRFQTGTACPSVIVLKEALQNS